MWRKGTECAPIKRYAPGLVGKIESIWEEDMGTLKGEFGQKHLLIYCIEGSSIANVDSMSCRKFRLLDRKLAKSSRLDAVGLHLTKLCYSSITTWTKWVERQ